MFDAESSALECKSFELVEVQVDLFDFFGLGFGVRFFCRPFIFFDAENSAV